MRKLLSILLLALFCLPLASTLFASTGASDASLPACCRRNGQHHCFGGMLSGNTLDKQQGDRFTSPTERCSRFPEAVVSVHSTLFVPSVGKAIFAGVVSHPGGTPQTESKLRISRSRSSQKRGPPATLSL